MTAKVIDHQQAIQGMMAERYLLSELNGSDLDAFEGHLFDCSVCFEQVRAGTEFVHYLKRIGAEEPAPAIAHSSWGQRLFGPVPAMVFAGMLLCVSSLSIYQQMALRKITAPQVVAVTTLHPESRGSGDAITASSNGFFELRAVFQYDPQLSAYQARVIDSSGKEMLLVPIPGPHPVEAQLRLNAGMFRGGKYALIITAADQAGGKRKTVETFPFELKLQD